MTNLDNNEKLNIVGIGIIASLSTFFIIYVLFSRIISLTVLENLENNVALLLIILGLFLISLISSILVSLWKCSHISQTSLLAAATMAYLCTLVITISLSYSIMLIRYPEMFAKVSGFEYVLIFPSVVMDFSIYYLGHPIYIGVVSIFVYYLVYIIFLEKFYQVK